MRERERERERERGCKEEKTREFDRKKRRKLKKEGIAEVATQS